MVKEEMNEFVHHFQQLRSCHDEKESLNREEIHIFIRIVSGGLNLLKDHIDSPPQRRTCI